VIVSFTASRQLKTATDLFHVRDVLEKLQRGDLVVTGGCIGGDHEIAKTATKLGLAVHTVLPTDTSRVDPEWEEWCVSWERMPEGTTYRNRNERLVELGNKLFGFPNLPESRDVRSGTWMTIRIARMAKVPQEVRILHV